MLYDLPARPSVTVVRPDDSQRWADLGADPAGRYALAVGDPTGTGDDLVIAGSLTDLAAYLHATYAALTGTVADLSTALDRHPDSSDPTDTPVPPSQPDDRPGPDTDLVTLPHTGIRVPDVNLQISTLRELPTPDGVAYTATVRIAGIPVGAIHNDGAGEQARYRPAAGSPFGYRHLAGFVVAASRSTDGRPLTEEQLLEALITEYRIARHVDAATRAGRTPLRLQAPSGPETDGAGPAGPPITVDLDTATNVTTPAQRDALAATLQRRYVDAWWQLWTGQRWEDLTTPAQPGPDRTATP